VFSRTAILELNLPARAEGNPPPRETLSIEVTIRRSVLEIGSREQGVMRRIARRPDGREFQELSELMKNIKSRFPDKLDATILAEPDTAYDTLVQVMDSVRTAEVGEGKARTRVELFPEISVGDAPIGG
jgi:biopolymer transport protein ExbD